LEDNLAAGQVFLAGVEVFLWVRWFWCFLVFLGTDNQVQSSLTPKTEGFFGRLKFCWCVLTTSHVNEISSSAFNITQYCLFSSF
jgi:hypothetical protein